MKALRTLLVAMTTIISVSASAQDWQIGGGAYNSSPVYGSRRYTYDDEYRSMPSSNEFFRQANTENPLSVTLGYVNKEWATNMGRKTIHENFWGETNKRMHGVQLGLEYAPYNRYGFGFHTGFFYECYLSFSDAVNARDFDSFSEHNIYIPAHVMIHVPIASNKYALSVYGGFGINWAICGVYSDYADGGVFDDEYTYNEYADYGHTYSGDYPKHFNIAAEVGAKFRVKNAQIGFTYSHGLNNHDLYEGYFTHQNKLNFNISWIIPK